MRRSAIGSWSRSAPVVGLVLALAGASLLVARVTPRSLITPPLRPETRFTNSRIQTTGVAYPRHAAGADNETTTTDRQPVRIISQFWSIDEYLYRVVPPARVVGVSESAYLPVISNVLAEVQRYQPIVSTDLERVLLANPDLIFSPDSARSDVPGLLRLAGLPVYRMHTAFETLASIEAHIRLVGYLTGEDERAAAEVTRFRDVVLRAAARQPRRGARPRVLGFGGSYSYGSRTLLADILNVLGARNLAAEHGFVGYDRVTDEHIVRWNPDWIVTGAQSGHIEDVRARLLASPVVGQTNAARDGHIVVLDNRIFLPLSPFTSVLVDELSKAFYGDGRS